MTEGVPAQVKEEDLETYAQKVRMALAEAGYPDAVVRVQYGSVHVVTFGVGAVPMHAAWKAFTVVYPDNDIVCYECWLRILRDPQGVCEAVGQNVEDCGRERT